MSYTLTYRDDQGAIVGEAIVQDDGYTTGTFMGAWQGQGKLADVRRGIESRVRAYGWPVKAERS